MDSAELISKFKAMPQKNRILAAALVGILYPAFVWSEDLPPVEEQLEAVRGEESAAKGKYERLQRDLKNLPNIEEEFEQTQEQLAKAKALLPEKIPMEDILSKTASIARETRILLKDFQPGQEQEIAGDYRYAEIPINVAIRGQFSNVMAFFDRLAHLSGNLRLRNLKFTPGASPEAGTAAQSPDVQASVTLVFFRSTETGIAGVGKQSDSAQKTAPAGAAE